MHMRVLTISFFSPALFCCSTVFGSDRIQSQTDKMALLTNLPRHENSKLDDDFWQLFPMTNPRRLLEWNFVTGNDRSQGSWSGKIGESRYRLYKVPFWGSICEVDANAK